MKNISMISIMCLVAALLGLIAPSLGELKYCPAPDIKRAGSCGAKGDEDCFFEVAGSYPASLMPRNIHCVNVGKNRSKCSFEIVCGSN
ncbi:hypothetical protein ABFS83_03G127000 [Erythranthe nasuta]